MNRFTVLATILVVACTSSVSLADRGRVVVKNGTILTDKETTLRGFMTDWNNSWASSYIDRINKTDIDAVAQKFGINCIRLQVWPTSTGSWDKTKCDKLINLCGDGGLYVVLCMMAPDNVRTGNYNRESTLAFWKDASPRYANRTHVIYEIHNEPKSWDFPYDEALINTFVDAYKIIRGVAPKTHVIMWSSANLGSASAAISTTKASVSKGVDYANASVGFHWYTASESNVLAVQNAGFPIVCTEYNANYLSDFSASGKGAAKWVAPRLASCEKLKISHLLLHGQWIDGSGSDPDWIKFMNEMWLKTYPQYAWCPDYGSFPKNCGGQATAITQRGMQLNRSELYKPTSRLVAGYNGIELKNQQVVDIRGRAFSIQELTRHTHVHIATRCK